MALAARLRCPLHSAIIGVRSCASQAPAPPAPFKSKDTKESTSSTPSSKPRPAPVVSEASTTAPRGGRAAAIDKPKTFEVAHLGDFGEKVPEKFIPVSRRFLIRRLIEDKSLLNGDQSGKFEQFALALNQSVATQMVHHLDEMKVGSVCKHADTHTQIHTPRHTHTCAYPWVQGNKQHTPARGMHDGAIILDDRSKCKVTSFY